VARTVSDRPVSKRIIFLSIIAMVLGYNAFFSQHQPTRPMSPGYIGRLFFSVPINLTVDLSPIKKHLLSFKGLLTAVVKPDRPGRLVSVEPRNSQPRARLIYYPVKPRSVTTADLADLDQLISRISNRYQVDHLLVKAVISIESGFNTHAKSPKGAMGLMQLMPATAKDLGVKDPFDPRQNIEGGVKYLAQLIDKFGGDLELALAAYNAGPEAVRYYGGIPPYPETRKYVKNVLSYWEAMKAKNRSS